MIRAFWYSIKIYVSSRFPIAGIVTVLCKGVVEGNKYTFYRRKEHFDLFRKVGYFGTKELTMYPHSI
jgi:hypothetical protein